MNQAPTGKHMRWEAALRVYHSLLRHLCYTLASFQNRHCKCNMMLLKFSSCGYVLPLNLSDVVGGGRKRKDASPQIGSSADGSRARCPEIVEPPQRNAGSIFLVFYCFVPHIFAKCNPIRGRRLSWASDFGIVVRWTPRWAVRRIKKWLVITTITEIITITN